MREISCITLVHSNSSGSNQIDFFLDEKGGLSVTMETERLRLRSCETGNFNDYACLFCDTDNVAKIGDGSLVSGEELDHRIKNIWVRQWSENNPFSSLAVYRCDDDEEVFVGQVELKKREEFVEIEFIFDSYHWNKGIGTESVKAVVDFYIPSLVEAGYQLNAHELRAKVRDGNPYAERILKTVGMTKVGEDTENGFLHYLYSRPLIVKV